MAILDLSNSIPQFETSPDYAQMNFIQSAGPLSMLLSGVGSSGSKGTTSDKVQDFEALPKEKGQIMNMENALEAKLADKKLILRGKIDQYRKQNPNLSESDVMNKFMPDFNNHVKEITDERTAIEQYKSNAKINYMKYNKLNTGNEYKDQSLAVMNGDPMGLIGTDKALHTVGEVLTRDINMGNNRILPKGYRVLPTDIKFLNPKDAINYQGNVFDGLNIGEQVKEPDVIDQSKGKEAISSTVQQLKNTWNSTDTRDVYKAAADNPYILLSNGSSNKNNYNALNKGVESLINNMSDENMRAMKYNLWSDYSNGATWLIPSDVKEAKKNGNQQYVKDATTKDNDGKLRVVKVKDYVDAMLSKGVPMNDIMSTYVKNIAINDIAPNYQKEIAMKSDMKESAYYNVAMGMGKDDDVNYWQGVEEGRDNRYSKSLWELGNTDNEALNKQIADARSKYNLMIQNDPNSAAKSKEEMADIIGKLMNANGVKYNQSTISKLLVTRPDMFVDVNPNTNSKTYNPKDYVFGYVGAAIDSWKDYLHINMTDYTVPNKNKINTPSAKMTKLPLYYNQAHPELSDIYTNQGLYIRRGIHDKTYNHGNETAGNTSHGNMFSYNGVLAPVSVRNSAITLGSPIEFLETRVDDPTNPGQSKITHVATKPFLIPKEQLKNIKTSVMTATGLESKTYDSPEVMTNLGIVPFKFSELSKEKQDELSQDNVALAQKLKDNNEDYYIVPLNEDYQEITSIHQENGKKHITPKEKQSTGVIGHR